MASFSQLQSQMQSQGPPEPLVGPGPFGPRVSTKGSCVDPSGNDPETGDSNRCRLYIEADPARLVAVGRVYEGSTLVHNTPLLPGQVKVSVDEVKDADAAVPVPTAEVSLVGQALPTFLAWSTHLIKSLSNQVAVSPPKPPPKPDPEVDDPLYLMTLTIPELFLRPYQVRWDATVFGVVNPDFPLYIKHEDLSEIAHGGQCLSISVLQFWILHLTETCMRAGNSDIYGFLEPQSIQRSGQSQFESESYIKSWMQSSQRDVYLGAYLNGGHWQMVVILPKEHLVVWFCSLHNRPDNYLKGIINSAIKGLDDAPQPKSKAPARWIVVKCNRQKESTECGYYVMHWMSTIILGTFRNNWEAYFNDPRPLEPERLKALRIQWTQFYLRIMVRTRGLGRALARDEHDAIDVPQRRRPTTSARRQQVHIAVDEGVPQVTEDVPHMAEDVPQMTEDVPHMADDVLQMSEDTPQMTADVDATVAEDLDRDGAEGSHADEGFPGGPRDPSVLTSFAEHVAHAIWTGQECPELKLVSHGRKVALIGRPMPKIEGLVVATGLSPLIGCSVVTGDPGLIFAFVERWHRETSTIHLPVGKLTITLDDVSSLLHLPISGTFHSFEALSVDEAVFLLMELLEVSGEEARAEKIRARGAYVHLSWVREIYEARRCIVAARAYLLHLIGYTVFPNKSATYVHVVHLEAFRDLGQSGGYAWGAAALVHMYDQLDEASRTTTRQIGGYLTLLQCWIYEHFPSVHQCVTDDAYKETSPRASRWLMTKAHMKGITGASHRACCDALTVTDVCWLPYSDHRGVRGFELISSFQGQLRWGPMVIIVRPERVLRQFGYIQSIPLSPVSASLSYDDIDDRWMHFSDHVVAMGELCVVPGQVSTDYMKWFFQISHPFMIPTQAGDQPRHTPAPYHKDYMQPDIPQVPVALDPPRLAVVRLFACLMFDELLFILNFVINVFYDCHMMIMKAMR
ncbi:Protein MAIN-LIKE 1 [Glycine max]|nr:Protein MAIN-LIKE 1 [Glycine max]